MQLANQLAKRFSTWLHQSQCPVVFRLSSLVSRLSSLRLSFSTGLHVCGQPSLHSVIRASVLNGLGRTLVDSTSQPEPYLTPKSALSLHSFVVPDWGRPIELLSTSVFSAQVRTTTHQVPYCTVPSMHLGTYMYIQTVLSIVLPNSQREGNHVAQSAINLHWDSFFHFNCGWYISGSIDLGLSATPEKHPRAPRQTCELVFEVLNTNLTRSHTGSGRRNTIRSKLAVDHHGVSINRRGEPRCD